MKKEIKGQYLAKQVGEIFPTIINESEKENFDGWIIIEKLGKEFDGLRFSYFWGDDSWYSHVSKTKTKREKKMKTKKGIK